MHLFQALTLSATTLPNRLVVACDADGWADGATAGDYAQRAGAGLIVTPALDVNAGHDGAHGLAGPAQSEAWRAIVEAVHQEGGRIVARLTHRGGDWPDQAGIAAQVEMVVAGAALARAAGFDGVEIAGDDGLIDRFLCSAGNTRRDAYGGSVRARARFLLEVTEAVAGLWGVERIGVRLAPRAGTDRDPRETVAHVAAALDQIGIAWLHLVEPQDRPRPILADLRRHFGGAVIATGHDAEGLIAAGLADCVSFADLSRPSGPAAVGIAQMIERHAK